MAKSWDNLVANRRLDSEAVIVQKLLHDFQVEGSRGKKFAEQFDPQRNWTIHSLMCLGMVCSNLTGVSFPRNYRRNRALIYKWFDDNYATLEPVFMIARLE
jgi:hypothetical protein